MTAISDLRIGSKEGGEDGFHVAVGGDVVVGIVREGEVMERREEAMIGAAYDFEGGVRIRKNWW